MGARKTKQKLVIVDPVIHSVGNRIFCANLCNELKAELNIIVISPFGFKPDELTPQGVNCEILSRSSSKYKAVERLFQTLTSSSATIWGIQIFIFSFMILMDLLLRRRLTGSATLYLIDMDPFLSVIFAGLVSNKVVLDLATNLALFQNPKYIKRKKGINRALIRLCRIILIPFIPKFVRKNNKLIASSQQFSSTFSDTVVEDAVVDIPVPVRMVTVKESAADRIKAILSGYNVDSDAKKLLMFGVNHVSKDYATIFKSLDLLNRHEKIKLIIAGRQRFDNANNPYRLKAEHDVEDNTVLILDRFFSEDDKAALFKAVDIVLIPLPVTFIYPSATLNDAIGVNSPVIAGDTGFVGKTVKDNLIGYTYNCGDHEDLASKIVSFPARGTEAYDRMASNMRTLSGRYSWQKIAQRYKGIFLSENV